MSLRARDLIIGTAIAFFVATLLSFPARGFVADRVGAAVEAHDFAQVAYWQSVGQLAGFVIAAALFWILAAIFRRNVILRCGALVLTGYLLSEFLIYANEWASRLALLNVPLPWALPFPQVHFVWRLAAPLLVAVIAASVWIVRAHRNRRQGV